MKKLLIGFIVAALFIPDAQAKRKKSKSNRNNITQNMKNNQTGLRRTQPNSQTNGYPSMPKPGTNTLYRYPMPQPGNSPQSGYAQPGLNDRAGFNLPNNGLPNQMPQPGNLSQFGNAPGLNTYDPAGWSFNGNNQNNLRNSQENYPSMPQPGNSPQFEYTQPGSYNTYRNGFSNQMPQPQQQPNNNNLTGGNFNPNTSNQYGSSLTGKPLVAEPEEIDYNSRRNGYPSIPQGTNSWGQTSNLRRAQPDYQVDYRGGGVDENSRFNNVTEARAFWKDRIANESKPNKL